MEWKTIFIIIGITAIIGGVIIMNPKNIEIIKKIFIEPVKMSEFKLQSGGSTGKLGGLYEATGEVFNYEDKGFTQTRGIASNGTHIFICDPAQDSIAIFLANHTLVQNTSTLSSGMADCRGMVANGTSTLIVTDQLNDKNYVFWQNLTPINSYSLRNGNNDSYGIGMNDTSIVTVDGVDLMLYVYDLNHNYLSNVSVSSFTSLSNSIYWNGTNWFLGDYTLDKIFILYSNLTYTGQSIDINTNGALVSVGITQIGNKLLVSNNDPSLIDGAYYYWATAQTPPSVCSDGSCLFNYTNIINDLTLFEASINGNGREIILKVNVTELCDKSDTINSAFLQFYIQSVAGAINNNISISYLRDQYFNESSTASTIDAMTKYNITSTSSNPNINLSSTTALTYTNVSITTQVQEACNRNEFLTLMIDYPPEPVTPLSATQNDYVIIFGDATSPRLFFNSRENQTDTSKPPKIYVTYSPTTNNGPTIVYPTQSTPVTVTYPQNITVNYTFVEGGAYITTGVTTWNITFYNSTNWYSCTLQGSATYVGSVWTQNCSISNLGSGTFNLNVTANTSTSGFLSDQELNAVSYGASYCWQISAGKVLVPPSCQFAINTNRGFN